MTGILFPCKLDLFERDTYTREHSMSLRPQPQSWDDVQPGDVITWIETKWSHKLGRNTERPRRLLVRWVADRSKYQSESVRSVWGVLVTKADQPHKSMNTYPLTDADHVSTGERGAVVGLDLAWITSLDRPSYVEEPAGATPAAWKRLKLTTAQQRALNTMVKPYDKYPTGYRPSYLIPTNTSVALIDKGLLTTEWWNGECWVQWLTREGFKVAGIDLDTAVAEARDAALIEHIERGHNPTDIVHNLDELAADAQIHAYAHDVEFTDSPKFPAGTPEYEAYATELHGELEKFASGKAPYEYDDTAREARERRERLAERDHEEQEHGGDVCDHEYTKRDDAVFQMDLTLGRADRKALPIVPPAPPKSLMTLVNEAIAAAVHAEKLSGLDYSGLAQRTEARAAARVALEAVQGRINDLERRAIPPQVDEAFNTYAKTTGAIYREGVADGSSDDPDAWRARVLARRQAVVEAARTFADTTLGNNTPSLVIYLAGGMLTRAETALDDWKEKIEK